MMNKSQAVRQALLQQDDVSNFDTAKVIAVSQAILRQNGNKFDKVEMKDVHNTIGNIRRRIGSGKLTKKAIQDYDNNAKSKTKKASNYQKVNEAFASMNFVDKYGGTKGVDGYKKSKTFVMTADREPNNSYKVYIDDEHLESSDGCVGQPPTLDKRTLNALSLARKFCDEVGGLEIAKQAIETYQNMVSI